MKLKKIFVFALAFFVLAPGKPLSAELTTEDVKEDTEFLLQAIFETHPAPFRHYTKGEWENAAKKLLSKDRITDPAIFYAELSRLLDLAKDGHLGIEAVDKFKYIAFGFPLQFHEFSDGLFIVTADERLRSLLGGRVVAFGSVPAEEALGLFRRISYHNNVHGKKLLVQQYLRKPALHYAVGTSDNPRELFLTVETANGEVKEFALHDLAPLQKDSPQAPPRKNAPEGWLDVRDAGGNSLSVRPLWQRHLDKQRWFTFAPELNAIFLQYVTSFEDADESAPLFAKRLAKEIQRPEVKRIIIDLRLNRGGDYSTMIPVLREILRPEKFDEKYGIFVLTSPYTNSAAVSFAAAMERYTNAIFVGRPTAAPPNYAAEAIFVNLPNSGFEIEIPQHFWVNSDPRDPRLWIHPDLPVPAMTFAEFVAGDDPDIAAISDAIKNDILPDREAMRGGKDNPGSWKTFFNWTRDGQENAVPQE